METPDRKPPVPRPPISPWSLLTAVVLLVLLLVICKARYAPPAVVAGAAGESAFSGERAASLLAELLPDDTPHPLGSAADAAVRDRIVANLTASGYSPEVQDTDVCAPSGVCARVQNVVARLAGREPGAAVLVAAHYDSVEAGPGASDDGSGVVAVLEVARILKAAPPPRHDVIFLVDEGEEAGLLGAQAFMEQHPAASDVKAVVNLDARGTSGASLMYETSPGNGGLIPMLGGLRRPITSSVFYTIYQRLPNDSDFTVFKAHGVQGFNFAFIGDPAHYHTRLDNVANADHRTLQHQGENALAAVRALAESDLSRPRSPDRVFFDLLALHVFSWPQGVTLPLAGVALLLVLIAMVLAARRGGAGAGGIALGVVLWIATVAVAALLAFGLAAALRLGGRPPAGWIGRPGATVTAYWFAALFPAGLFAALLWRRAGFWGMWSGVWLVWALGGLALAILAPGVSYLLLAPALLAGVVGLLLALRGSPFAFGYELAAFLPAALAACLLFPFALLFYEAMGVGALFVVTLVVALVTTTVAPLLGGGLRWAVAAVAFFVLIASAIASFLGPVYTADTPRAVNLLFFQQGDAAEGKWIATAARLPPPLAQAAAFGKSLEAPFPWAPEQRRYLVAPAPDSGALPPGFLFESRTVEGGKRHFAVRLTSSRGARILRLYLPDALGVESIEVEGQHAPGPLPGGYRPLPGWRVVSYMTTPEVGVRMELTMSAQGTGEAFVADQTPGLPPGGEALDQARGATMTAISQGDATIMAQSVSFAPAPPADGGAPPAPR